MSIRGSFDHALRRTDFAAGDVRSALTHHRDVLTGLSRDNPALGAYRASLDALDRSLTEANADGTLSADERTQIRQGYLALDQARVDALAQRVGGSADVGVDDAYASSGAYTDAPTDGAPLREGMRGPRVEQLQRELKAAGYDVVVDGYLGPETAAAARAHELQRSASALGDTEYDAAVGAEHDAVAEPYDEHGRYTPATDNGIPLRPGHSGPRVEALQQELVEAGLMDADDVDGYYGPATATAVEQLNARRASERMGDVEHEVATGPARLAARAREEAAARLERFGQYTPGPADPAQVGLGMSGEGVRALQRQLVEEGLLRPDQVDGFFGAATQAAMEARS